MKQEGSEGNHNERPFEEEGDSRREEVKGVIGSTPLRQGVLGTAMWDVGCGSWDRMLDVGMAC